MGGGFTFFHYAIIEEIEKLFSPLFLPFSTREFVTLRKKS